MAAADAASSLRVLVLCTGNSARSQIAEALLNRRGAGRVAAASAGTDPAPRVNPWAVRVLAEAGIDWQGHAPRGLGSVPVTGWDLVITVCDHARESCPVFPGRTMTAHWGMSDPAAVEGGDEARLAAFRETLRVLERRVDLLLAVPRGLPRPAWLARVRAIGQA